MIVKTKPVDRDSRITIYPFCAWLASFKVSAFDFTYGRLSGGKKISQGMEKPSNHKGYRALRDQLRD